jgi:cell division protease FtsH
VAKVTTRGTEVRGLLKEPNRTITEAGDTTLATRFITYVPSFGDSDLLSLLEAHQVEIETRPEQENTLFDLLLWGLLPFLLLGAFLVFSLRGMASRQAHPLFSLGKSGAKKYERETSVTTFGDVAGAAGAKQELKEVVQFLKNPERFHQIGAAIPKGILLVGPPGTGKTLLARAVAGEANVSFFHITGSDFMEMFVGVGAKRVRDLFKQAKKVSPSIVFIDELDSIGRRRGSGLGGGHDEREQTLNQLLSELDGFEPTNNLIVMAATNRPDILDPALLRPGRFDRRITVDLPSAGERLAILRLHAKALRLDPDVDLEPTARGTPGFSGADLKNLLNEAALHAARHEEEMVRPQDLEAARDRILMGLRREGVALTEKELELLAYHEAGHAVLAAILPTTDPIHKVTIIPRGRAMGSTQQLPDRDRFIWEKEALLDQLAMILGGRAAEILVFRSTTSGAQDDLERATKLARRMVLQWGMSPELGPFAATDSQEPSFLGDGIPKGPTHSEQTGRTADSEIRRILGEAQSRAEETLSTNREALEGVAALLLGKEEITGQEVLSAVRGKGTVQAGSPR